MTTSNTIYPRISLPFRLRVLFSWNRIMLFSAFSADDKSNSPIALEREFKSILTRENTTISKICFSYSGSVAEFDDLRQDALINIWRGLKNFRGDASERTWIYRVTVNSCISTIKKQSRHQHESLEGLYGLIERDDPCKEMIEQMHMAIATLGSQEKAIILMWLDELSYDEIASAMGLNRNTVATKIRRIKEKIIKAYNSDFAREI